MKVHPESASSSKFVASLENVLHFRGEVERQRRMFSMHRADDLERVTRSVQKIGIGEVDVARARLDELSDIGEHGFRGHDEKAPVVDRGQRAVPAVMAAAATRFDGSDDRVRSVGALDMNVAVELREPGSLGHEIVEPLPKRCRCQGHALVPGDPGHQRFVALATQNGIGSLHYRGAFPS